MTDPEASDTKPNPGSDAAYDAGCVCPRMDNNRGKYPPRPPAGWFIVTDCPMHGGWSGRPGPAREP